MGILQQPVRESKEFLNIPNTLIYTILDKTAGYVNHLVKEATEI
jgi:hypothetical protein